MNKKSADEEVMDLDKLGKEQIERFGMKKVWIKRSWNKKYWMDQQIANKEIMEDLEKRVEFP